MSLKELEKVYKALSDRNRIRILKMLQTRPMCVCELREVLGLAQPSVSKHLKILRDAGLLGDEQEGLWTNYRLLPDNDGARAALKNLRGRLDDDEVIVRDLRAARGVKKEALCKK